MTLCGCSSKYDPEDFLGRTSEEIVREYGSFDCATNSAGEDGLYRNSRCGYTIKEKQKGFIDSTEEVLFFIHFDENGVADKCSEGCRPGG